MMNSEKKMIVTVVVCILVLVAFASHVSTKVEQAGGLKKITINTGKEIKDISR